MIQRRMRLAGGFMMYHKHPKIFGPEKLGLRSFIDVLLKREVLKLF